MQPMLARLLPQSIRTEDSPERPSQVVVLPFSRPRSAAQRVDWYAKYPSTRMHGAAFEAEFHPAEDTF
jgi:hypothetical protein